MAITRRVTQEVIEVVVQDTNPTRRVTQVVAEAVVQDTNPTRRVTQIVIEVVVGSNPRFWATVIT